MRSPAVLVALTLIACREEKPQSRARSPDASAPIVTVPDASRAPRDVTFIVASDLHFGYPTTERENAKLVARVNALTHTVLRPRGLIITGDLTEWGREDEWAAFVELFGLHGTEGALKLPVFEMIGNHDRVANGPWIGEQVAARHGGRFYSWDWDDVHLVALGEAPDDEGLLFLAKDLARLRPGIPIVLFFHLALAGPWSTGNWFADELKDRLAQILSGRNVVGIFHGHHHATGHYQWHSIDVFKPGAVKDGSHRFAVVRVTDKEWTVTSYDWHTETRVDVFTKPIAGEEEAPGVH